MTDEELRLVEITNRIIMDLVHDKVEMLKAYNYYNGIRDAEQFKYLEDNFGIGSPTSVEFTPLIRKHVDALVGEFLGTPILPKVSCKDKETITNIAREKQLLINKEIAEFLSNRLQNQILKFIGGQGIEDISIKQLLDDLIDDLEEDFTSQYEIAALNVIEYLMQHRKTDFKTKLQTIILDLLVSGYSYFRSKPSPSGTNVEIEVLDPRNTFDDNNPESPYVKDSKRIVVRKWMTRQEILARYGKDLSSDDVKILRAEFQSLDLGTSYYRRELEGVPVGYSEGIRARFEAAPGHPELNYYKNTFIPVYEVEWIETDEDFIMQRYQTVRIGDNQNAETFFILKGKDENVVRTKDDPAYCPLSINGVYFLNRSQEPFSLVLSCAGLQDRYDILNFYRDNLIANSGTVGDWIDESLIPTNLGVDWPSRVQKWLSYKKNGIGLIDTASDERQASGQAPINTIFNGFDDTVKVQAVQAIQLAIDQVEQTCSSITGVFRERLQGIEQRDAVTNIKLGVQNSFIVTKKWYHQMDLATAELLLDALNVAKVVYKKGLTGTLILGDRYQKIFTALPEFFTLTDYDIHIVTSTDVVKDLELIKAIVPEFVKSGSLPPDLIFEALTSKSLTDIKWKIRKALKKLKQENNALQLALLQLQEMQQLMQQLQNQNQQLQSKVESLNQQKLQIESQKVQLQNQVDMYKAQTDRKFKEDSIKIDLDKVKIEQAQLYDNNPYNDKVNMS